MSAKEVKELRKAGRLNEALEMALLDLKTEPDNIWSKRSISWVYYEFAKKNLDVIYFETFIKYLGEISDLQLPAEENMIFDSLAWLVVKNGYGLLKEKEPDINKVTTLLNYIKTFHLTKPSEVYSAVFKLFHKAYKDTDNYIEFADWWNFENFRTEDYTEENLANGQKGMAMVEQAYIAYAKHLLPKQKQAQYGEISFDSEKAEDFALKLGQLEQQHPEYQYPVYYKAKLLLALGEHDNVFSILLPFARKNKSVFWIWDILSETFTDKKDEDKVFACYCKALQCATREEMLIKVREKILKVFIKKEMWAEAKTEVIAILEITKKKGWKISPKIAELLKRSWFSSVQTKNSNSDVYQVYAHIAEELLFGDIPETKVAITFVNSDKKLLSFIESDTKSGFFKYDRFLQTAKVGDVLKIRILKTEEGGRCLIATAGQIEDLAFRNRFVKEFEGIVSIREDSRFGFVRPDIFLSVEYCAKNKLKDGQKIAGTAIKSYNPKAEKWGWAAF
ncbi:MAG: hypothetical protein LBT50_00500 [Prevotellaceae bacterium]|jgi:hypothetical protein|nr:hypothetical protein [Prevotellaceae bacterium]